MKSTDPKQFMKIRDREMYLYLIDTLRDMSALGEVVLVCPKERVNEVSQKVPEATVVSGGKTRQESSFLGLKGFKREPKVVLIHDGARPFLSKDIIQRNIEAVYKSGAVDTCIPSADTLVRGGLFIEEIPDRKQFLRGQTPQSFEYSLIYEAHEKALEDGIFDASDDCQLVHRLGKSIQVVLGSNLNFKVTTRLDLQFAEFILSSFN